MKCVTLQTVEKKTKYLECYTHTHTEEMFRHNNLCSLFMNFKRIYKAKNLSANVVKS